MIRWAFACLGAISVAASAQESVTSDTARAARDAMAQLNAASLQLERAVDAEDRVDVLATTIRAFEAALEAVRDGLRRMARRTSQMSETLASREAEVSALLAILIRMESAPPVIHLLHPEGPTGAARAAMLLAEATPILSREVTRLGSTLAELRALGNLQEEVLESLGRGLADIQQARAELSQAMAERVAPPQRFAANPARMAQLAASVRSLDQFIEGLGTPAYTYGPSGDDARLSASMPLDPPVAGLLLRGFNESDAAGVARPGLIIATRPEALVTAPVAATIRYLGPLLDFGHTAILEPRSGLLFVFSGLGTVYGKMGQVIPEGAPVGLVGGRQPGTGSLILTNIERQGESRPETLYIEVREEGRTVDPGNWFAFGKGG